MNRRCWKNVECFWSHRSRKEGLDNAGWSGRSYIVLLVVFVLNVDDGRMNGLSMLATMFSRLDVPNCDLVFLRLLSSPLRQDDTEDIFLFSLHRWNRSVAVPFFFSLSFFSRVQHEWMCRKKCRIFLYWVGRSMVACRVDYLHRDVLDNDGWNGHHDQAHIFLGKRIVIFHACFSIFSF